jgi:hypothetical protein
MSNFIMKSRSISFMNRLSRRKRAWVCLTYYRSHRSVVLKIQLHDTQTWKGLVGVEPPQEQPRCYFERAFHWVDPKIGFADPTSSVSRSAREDRLFHLVKKRDTIGPGFYNGFDLLNTRPRVLDRVA